MPKLQHILLMSVLGDPSVEFAIILHPIDVFKWCS